MEQIIQTQRVSNLNPKENRHLESTRQQVPENDTTLETDDTPKSLCSCRGPIESQSPPAIVVRVYRSLACVSCCSMLICSMKHFTQRRAFELLHGSTPQPYLCVLFKHVGLLHVVVQGEEHVNSRVTFFVFLLSHDLLDELLVLHSWHKYMQNQSPGCMISINAAAQSSHLDAILVLYYW